MLLPKYLVCCVFLCRLIFLSHFAIFNKKEQISINNTTILASIMKFLDAESPIIAKPMFNSAGSILIEIEKSTILTQFFRIEIVKKSSFFY